MIFGRVSVACHLDPAACFLPPCESSVDARGGELRATPGPCHILDHADKGMMANVEVV
jgi:hypothetical protein